VLYRTRANLLLPTAGTTLPPATSLPSGWTTTAWAGLSRGPVNDVVTRPPLPKVGSSAPAANRVRSSRRSSRGRTARGHDGAVRKRIGEERRARGPRSRRHRESNMEHLHPPGTGKPDPHQAGAPAPSPG